MAELADAAGSKSAEVHPSWGFDSPSRHQLCNPVESAFRGVIIACTTFLQDYPQLNEADIMAFIVRPIGYGVATSISRRNPD